MTLIETFVESNLPKIKEMAKKFSNDGDLGRFARVEFKNQKELFEIPNDRELGSYLRKKINFLK